MMKRFVALSLLLTAPLSASAYWGDIYCDLEDPAHATESFQTAVHDYVAEGGCRYGIRFLEPMTVTMSQPLVIAVDPPNGANYGTAIRRCAQAGNECSGDEFYLDSQFVLDFTGYKWDCPIRIAEGARVDFIGLRVISWDAERTFCTFDGEPIPLEDLGNPYASIHRVEIVEAGLYQRFYKNLRDALPMGPVSQTPSRFLIP